MLTGSDLLAKVKELGDVSKSDLVRSCGYQSTKKDGTERLNWKFLAAALLCNPFSCSGSPLVADTY
jgi:hypothetical protein